jgi:hypothetical protein
MIFIGAERFNKSALNYCKDILIYYETITFVSIHLF